MCGGGYVIHWNKIDEDLILEGLIRGSLIRIAKKVERLNANLRD
jgi:hypothetical protein